MASRRPVCRLEARSRCSRIRPRAERVSASACSWNTSMEKRYSWAALLRALTANRASESTVAAVIDRRYRTVMSLLRLCEWLAATPGSIALHESRYLYLVVLSVHVLTLCLFVGTAAIVDLRLMGLTMQSVRVSEVMERLLPWTVAGFLLMIVSGSLLFYAAPLLRYQNIFFRAKMVVLV